MKRIFLLLILLPILLIPCTIYARAGGGGGGGAGGGGGIIGLIAWGIYTAIVSVILFLKTTKSDYIISWAFKKDKLWDINQMKLLSKSVFIKMQQAWMNRDIDSVKDIISNDLYQDYKQQLHVMKENKEKDMLGNIYVSDVKIISCEDFNDNSKDSFVAYIKGTILDYTISEETKTVIKNEKKEQEKFKDPYHFIRQQNKWILNYIDNDVTISDLISAKNYKED